MKRDVRILLDKSLESLHLAIELFNRPYNIGRTHAVIILLDHSFEMLLKTSLLHKKYPIFDKKTANTIGFKSCLRCSIGNGSHQFLTTEQALVLQTINDIRDAEQHYHISTSENQLYLYVQMGFSLYKELLKQVFDISLFDYFPTRVLPISSTPPIPINILYENEIEEIKKLLSLGSRKKSIALSRLKSLEILERSLSGEEKPITDLELRKKLVDIATEKDWSALFPSVSMINVVPDPEAPAFALRFTKKEGIPVHIVPEGTPGAAIVGLKKVNELGFYNMGRDQLADAVHLSKTKTDAVIWYLNLKENDSCCKMIPIGKSSYYKYSPKAISEIKVLLESTAIEEVWDKYRHR